MLMFSNFVINNTLELKNENNYRKLNIREAIEM